MRPTDLLTLATTTPDPGVSYSWFEIGLVIFVVIFLAIVVWVVFARPGAFNDAARIPLDDQQVVSPRTSHGGATQTEATEPNHGKPE